ncbi:Uncharacterised protein [uncultured archaeon]|nr:Uncharacterised protein [uncultured archaeon]
MQPLEVMEFKPVEMSYVNFSEDRFPNFAVYYVFPNHRNVGICREFKVDLQRYLLKMGKRVYPTNSYIFKNEEDLLGLFDQDKKQGIRTCGMNGMSFTDLTEVIANIHRDEFFKKYYWLETIEIK